MYTCVCVLCIVYSLYFLIISSKREDNETLCSSKIITHALFIDSTWNQSSGILKDPMISSKVFQFF